MKLHSYQLTRIGAIIAFLLGSLGLHGATPVALGKSEDDPVSPTNVSALPISVQEVDLSWSAVSMDASTIKYSIRRNDQRIAVVSGRSLIFVDTDIQPSTTYTYTVRTIDQTGQASGSSNVAVVQTPALPDTIDITPPSPPTSLTATADPGSVVLDWYDASDDSDITAYIVRRNGLIIARLNQATLAYTDTSVQPSTAYTYTVEAVDVMGQHSVPSNSASVTSVP
jgi:hypothetical protein